MASARAVDDLTDVAPAVDNRVSRRAVGKWAARGGLALLGLAALVAWIALLYGVSIRAFAPNSDDANAILAGQAMAHGNAILHGWRLPADSWWSLDSVVYAGLYAWAGLSTALAHWGPIAIAVTLVAIGACTATVGLRRGRAVAAGVVIILIGLPTALEASVLLQGSLHVSTALAFLAALCLLVRPDGTLKPAFAGIILAAAVVGDPYAYVIGVVPLVAASLAGQVRGARPALLARRLVVIGGGVLAAFVCHLAIRHLGGFSTSPPPDRVGASQWLPNLGHAVHWWAADLGISTDSLVPEPSGFQRLIHVAGALIVATALVGFVWLLVRAVVGYSRARRAPDPEDLQAGWIEDGLLFGVLGSVAGYILLNVPPGDKAGTRYVFPALIYGALLGARLVGRTAGRLEGPSAWIPRVGLAILAGLYAWAPVATVAQGAAVPVPTEGVARWLISNGYTAAIGSYWEASLITLQTRGAVVVRPVAGSGTANHLHWYSYNASEGWFSPSSISTRALVYSAPCGTGGVGLASAIATFGLPERVVELGNYRVAIWTGDIVRQVEPPVYDWHQLNTGCPTVQAATSAAS